MEASLKRENTRIRDRLAALRCRGGEDAVLFGAAPPGVPFPESAPAKVKYQPPSQLTTVSASATVTQLQHGKEGTSGHSSVPDDLMGAIENLVRTILEDKDGRVSKANCYRALQKYATAQLEIRQVRVQLLRLQREAAPNNGEQQIVKLGEFLKDLQVIHKEQSRLFREAIEAKDAQLYYQEEKLKASKSQVQELESQLQLLREKSVEYENEIRTLNAALVGVAQQAAAGVDSEHRSLPPPSGESQEEKDRKIRELQAQLDALMSVKSGDLEEDVADTTPSPDSRQASMSEVSLSMGDYCDFLEPSVVQAGKSATSRNEMIQTSASTANKDSKSAERAGGALKQHDDAKVARPRNLDEPHASVQQGSSQSFDVLANASPPENDASKCVPQDATSRPVAIRSILRKPRHSASMPTPPQPAQVDATDAEGSQDMQIGSSNVSLDLLVAMDKGGRGGPRSNSPVVKSKGAVQKQSTHPPVPTHPTGWDASLEFLVGSDDKASTTTPAAPARTEASSAISAPFPLPLPSAATGTHSSEGSLNDFDFGEGTEDVAQASNSASSASTSTSNISDEVNDSSGSLAVPDNQRAFAGSEPSLQDDLFGAKKSGIEESREEEKKDSEEFSSVGTPEPDNQTGFDESEASLPDKLFPDEDSSSEGVTMHHDDVVDCEESVETTGAKVPQMETETPDDFSSIASPVPDNQRGFDSSEASLRDELFITLDEDISERSGEEQESAEVVASATPPVASDDQSVHDGQLASQVGEICSENRGDLGTHSDDISSVDSPMPDNQKGFDESEASLEDDDVFENQVDDESHSSVTRIEDGKETRSDDSSSAATSVPDNQKGFNMSEPSLNDELFPSQDDRSEHTSAEKSNGKDTASTDQSQITAPCVENPAIEASHGHLTEDEGGDEDVLSTCTPEPDNQKGYDESEGSLNDNLFDIENDAELDVIEEDDEASSIASETDKQDGPRVVKLESSADALHDDAASAATSAPDNQQGYDPSERSMTDELFVGEQADDRRSSEPADALSPVRMDGASVEAPSPEAETPEIVLPQSPLKEGILFVPDQTPQSPDFRDLTVDGSTLGELDEGQDESSTIDSVTGVSYLHGSEELTEQLVREACQIEERKPEDAPRAPTADPEPSSMPPRDEGQVSSPARRAERVIHPELKRQDTVSSTFGVDSLRFLTAGDESQRSATRTRHSKHFDDARLNRSVSNSRSRPPLFSSAQARESKPSNNDEHASDMERALELSASRARSIELSKKVEQLTLQLEQERVAFSNEHKSVQSELQATKEALEKCKGAAAALEKELTETEYNLVQAKQKVSMLEAYVVEDLVPPDDVVDACYASKGRVRQSPNESVDDQEVKLLKREAADLRSQLTVANTLVIKLEDDRSRQLKKIADLTDLLQTNKDSKKRLFEKSVECADLASERDLLQVQLANLREKNTSLEEKLSETLEELEDLRISSAQKSVRDFAIPAEHLEERERTLNRVMETSIELAECKMKLDTVTEQLKAEQKKNQELAASMADLDRSSSVGGLRTRVSLNLSNHTPSPTQRGGRNMLGLSSGILSNSYHGNTTTRPEATDVQRLQRTVAELEQQNEAYRLQVASLKQKSRMGTVQE